MRANVYTRPNKPLTCKQPNIKIALPLLKTVNTPLMLQVDKSTECHTTPDGHALTMAKALNYKKGESVYEPHAGTGQLIQGLINTGVPINAIFASELHHKLFTFTKQRFERLNIVQSDFLQIKQTFDNIICNPPFKPIKAHMKHAKKLLNKNGVLVAIVPITYNDIAHEVIQELPKATFAHCDILTKIIRITH